MQTKIPYTYPPHGHEIELRFIASLVNLGDPNNLRVQQAMLKVDRECFYDSDHKILYDLLRALFDKGHVFNFVDFMEVVPNQQYHLVTQAVKDDYMFTNHIEHDTEKLLTFRALRKQVKILVDALNASIECTLPEESLESISQSLQEISVTGQIGNKSYKRTTEEILDEIFTNGIISGEDFPVDIPGLPPVPNEAMITIAGRSGHGKTFFALYLMDKIIEVFPEKQAIYFNLEMRDHVLLERLAILNGFKASTQIATLQCAAPNLVSKNLTLVTKSCLTIEEIETESRLSAMQKPLNVIVVDYLGLIRTKDKHESNHLQQSAIAKRLASLATDLKCVVLCLIQVNRDIKNRPVSERCPIPTDSAESMGSVDSSSWWLGINQPQNDLPGEDEFREVFQIECRKTRTDSGLFNLKLKFKNGMFWKYERPFCPSRAREPEGF